MVLYADGVFEDLVELSAYLAESSEARAQTFLDACDDTFRFLAANPYIGSPRKFYDPALSALRMWRVKGFEKYLIFYTVSADDIKILHVFHSATDYSRMFGDE